MPSLSNRWRLSCKLLLVTLTLSLAISAQNSARAQDNNEPPKGFKALFNGHDFDNWVGGLGDMDARKIAAMSSDERAKREKELTEGAHKHWRVEDGVLVSDGDPHFFLST